MARFKKRPFQKALVRHRSVSGKAWTAFCDESLVGASEIASLHANRLRLRLRFNRLLERHGPFLAEHCLGHHVRKGRALRDFLRKSERFFLKLVGRDQPVEEAPLRTLLRAHRAASEQEFRSAALPDNPRQHGARTHVAACKADAAEKECGLRLRRTKPHVAEQRDHRAGAYTDAVDRKSVV